MKNAGVQLCLVITFILIPTQTAWAVPTTVEYSFMKGSGGATILTPRYLPAKAWTFDLRPKGFDPDTYDIISARLTLGLSDWANHGGEHGASEYALLDAGEDRFGPWEVDGAYGVATAKSFTLSKSLDYLSDYGTLPVTLRIAEVAGKRGDFALYWAKLVVDAEPQPPSVPEPGSIALLGLGLAVFFSMRSRLKACVFAASTRGCR